MQENIILLLPMAWALVATLIGIVLYRSSEALFENVSGSKNKKRSVRLTGSVVIAALAFYGMKSATPHQNLFVDSPGIMQVSVESLDQLKNQVGDQLNALTLLEACMELDQVGSCKNQLAQQITTVQRIQERVDIILEGR